MSDVLSITKQPVIYEDEQYFVTLEEYDSDRQWHSYIEAKIYVLNASKFRILKYKKVYDDRFNFDEWRGKYKELMIEAVRRYSKGIHREKAIEKYRVEVRNNGLQELEKWNGII